MLTGSIADLVEDNEFSGLIPPLNGHEYELLENSIMEEGCRDPIVIWGKIIVDGHHRYEICLRHSIPFEMVSLEFDDRDEAMIWIIKNQLGRRNLTTWQRTSLVEKIRPLLARKGRIRQKEAGEIYGRGQEKVSPEFGKAIKPIDTDKELGKLAGISHSTIAKAHKVQKEATTTQIEQLDKGETSIHKVYEEVKEKKSHAQESKSVFNQTTEKVDWAKWTWNPYTGCLGPDGNGPCRYCYARDIANRFYEEKFEPTFRPERLAAPFSTKIPRKRQDEPGIKNVFVCSMGDLFGSWVDQRDIDRIMDVVKRVDIERTRAEPAFPIWTFIFLTKNPGRLADIHWPANAWVGTTIDIQNRVIPAVEAFRRIRATVKFISFEPLEEEITFPKVGELDFHIAGIPPEKSSLSIFDWVIIGGRSKSSKMPAAQPKWDWVESLLVQARGTGCKVYFKPNLTVVPKEYPD